MTHLDETDVNSTLSPHDQTEYSYTIVMMVINVVIIIIVTWILISLLHYANKYKKWRRNSNSNSEQLNAGLIFICVILCAVSCLFYDVAVLIYVTARFTTITVQNCNFLSDLLHLFYASVILTVNLFLWLRQRAFYGNESLNVKFKKQIKVFSFFSIFIIFTGGLTGLLFVVIPYDITSSVYGCIDEPSKNGLRNAAFYIIIVSVVFGQSSLCFLFIYALRKGLTASLHEFALSLAFCCNSTSEEDTEVNRDDMQRKRSSFNPNSVDASTINRRRKKTMRLVKRTVQKTILFAFLSVVSDLIVIFSVHRIPELLHPRQLGAFVGLFGCSLDLIFVILSFLSWREMVTSPCFCCWSTATRQNNFSQTSRQMAPA